MLLGIYNSLIYMYIILLFYFATPKLERSIECKGTTCTREPKLGNKLPYWRIVVLSVLFGIYSVSVSANPYTRDRNNYTIRFVGNWKDPWTPGLNLLARFLHLFTNDERYLFFAISFLCAFLALVAYKTCRIGNRNAVLLLLCSQFLLFSFAGFKQAPANSLGAIAIILFIQNRYILSIIPLVLAVLFHESAYIVIIMMGVCFNSKHRLVRYAFYLLLLLSLMFYSDFVRALSAILDKTVPNLAEEGVPYLESTTLESVATSVKGFPFYLLSYYAIRNRKEFCESVPKYDSYMILSVATCSFLLFSMRSYWLHRLAYYFYIPLFSFASEIYELDTDRRRANSFLFMLVIPMALITIRYILLTFLRFGGF